MKIKMIKGFANIAKGSVLPVRDFWHGDTTHYQVIDGPDIGKIIPPEFCFVIDEEKTFTETEWNGMVKKYTRLLDEEKKRTKHWIFEALKAQSNVNRLQRKLDEIKQGELVDKVNQKLLEWTESPFECDEATDRMNFAKELTSFMSQELSK